MFIVKRKETLDFSSVILSTRTGFERSLSKLLGDLLKVDIKVICHEQANISVLMIADKSALDDVIHNISVFSICINVDVNSSMTVSSPTNLGIGSYNLDDSLNGILLILGDTVNLGLCNVLDTESLK